MTRDQAIGIIENIRLIEHFANGGEVTHPSTNHRRPCRSLLISNLRAGDDWLYRIGKMPPPRQDAVEEHRVT